NNDSALTPTDSVSVPPEPARLNSSISGPKSAARTTSRSATTSKPAPLANERVLLADSAVTSHAANRPLVLGVLMLALLAFFGVFLWVFSANPALLATAKVSGGPQDSAARSVTPAPYDPPRE
ncbi:MAG: hypothetical protein AAFP90_05140, partial [Planctomycetota bacterium]